MARLPVESVDEASRTVTFTGRTAGLTHYSSLPKSNRYLVENVREALSEPGDFSAHPGGRVRLALRLGALGAMGCLMNYTDFTFELIAYRKPENCGTPRPIDSNKVIRFRQDTFPNTFNNYDSKHSRVLVAPHGPDPVYFGVRGESLEVVSSAIEIFQPVEELEGWTVFRPGGDPIWRNPFHRKQGKIEAQGYHVFALSARDTTSGK